MTAGMVFSAKADVTINVNKSDVVTFVSNVGQPDMILQEGPNVFSISLLIGELRVSANDYKMICKNETSGETYPVVNQMYDFKVDLDPENVKDGDIINVTVIPSDEDEIFTVVFDNPDAGYLATLTDYDIFESCDGNPTLESNEDEYYFPDDDGEIKLPYEYNKRIRFRTYDGYSLVKVWNENETNPHAQAYTPNDYGVIEMNVFTINSFNVIRVKTAEHGTFLVKGEGNGIKDIYMTDNLTYQQVELSTEFLPIDFTGQSYTIRSNTSSISKIEVTNKGITEELIGFDGTYGYYYTPTKGDELVIYTHDTTGVNSIGQNPLDKEIIYNLNGQSIRNISSDQNYSSLPKGIYIKGGKKFIVK